MEWWLGKLHCTALHCTALDCTALHCTALHCTALHCTALHCTALHWTDLVWSALHWTDLVCTALVCSEEDLEIAPDFFEMFGATAPLLDDPAENLLAVSAFNDNGLRTLVDERAAH
eukprot:COSAG06_NODE_11697_length_1476_cov_1.461147_1_plen_116_part_00